ncbi:TPA: hypothetical protein SLG40_001714 [Serratia odorifera]|nr:hypothetical protein [Serratia odorifera]
MADVVRYQNKIILGAEILPPPHPMDGSCKGSILIHCEQSPEIAKMLSSLGEWDEIELEINGEKTLCQVEKYDRERNIIALKSDKRQSNAEIPYQQEK